MKPVSLNLLRLVGYCLYIAVMMVLIGYLIWPLCHDVYHHPFLIYFPLLYLGTGHLAKHFIDVQYKYLIDLSYPAIFLITILILRSLWL